MILLVISIGRNYNEQYLLKNTIFAVNLVRIHVQDNGLYALVKLSALFLQLRVHIIFFQHP